MVVSEVRNYISEKILMKMIKGLFIALIFFFPYSISIRETLIGLLFIFYVLKKLLDWDLFLTKTPFDKEIIIYLLFSFMSLFKVNNVLTGFEEIIVSPFKYMAFFYIAYDLINKEKIVKYLNILFYGSFSFLIIGKVVFHITGKNYLGGNGAGTWATFSIFMFIYLLINNEEKYFKKGLAIFGAILGVNVLFTTNSRGAVLAFAGGLLISLFMLASKKIVNKKRLFAMFFLIITLIIIAIPFVLPQKLINKFENIKDVNTHWSLKTRVIMWESSLYNIVRNPILGVGIGDFQTNYLNYIDNVIEEKVPRGARIHDHPHNLFLYIAVEQGIMSLIVFLFILFKSFKICFANFNSFDLHSKEAYLGILLCGMLVSLTIHSMVDTTFRYGHVGYYIMMIIILNLKLNNFKKESV